MNGNQNIVEIHKYWNHSFFLCQPSVTYLRDLKLEEKILLLLRMDRSESIMMHDNSYIMYTVAPPSSFIEVRII